MVLHRPNQENRVELHKGSLQQHSLILHKWNVRFKTQTPPNKFKGSFQQNKIFVSFPYIVNSSEPKSSLLISNLLFYSLWTVNPSLLFWNGDQHGRCGEAEPAVRAVRVKVQMTIRKSDFLRSFLPGGNLSALTHRIVAPIWWPFLGIDMIGKPISIEEKISQTHQWSICRDKEPSVQSKSHVRCN